MKANISLEQQGFKMDLLPSHLHNEIISKLFSNSYVIFLTFKITIEGVRFGLENGIWNKIKKLLGSDEEFELKVEDKFQSVNFLCNRMKIDLEKILNQEHINISEPENIEKIKKRVIPIISTKILDNVPVMMKMIAEPIIKNVLDKEGDEIIIKIGNELVGHMEENFDIKQIVEKKILSYDTRNVEKIILKVAKKEFTHIEYLGAVIGFVVGLFQVVLFLVL